jgi:TonB family protein
MKNKLLFVLVIILLSIPILCLAQDNGVEVNQEEPLSYTEEGVNESENVAPPPANNYSQPVTTEQKSVSVTVQQNKISLDIKGMDIIDILKMLSARAGMNIVVGKNVTGRVTLFLKDVDIWDAFEIILLANDLAYEKKGDIINVMSQRDYELLHGERYKDNKRVGIIKLKYVKAADLSRALNQIKTNIGRVVVDEGSNTLVLIDTPEKLTEMEVFIKNTDLPIQTRIFNLNYAQADKLSAKIQETLTKGIGYIRIDERTNKIAVTDYVTKLEEITKVISAFDEKSPQVLIDAQIIEITPTDAFKMGVDWDYWIRKHFRLAANLAGGSGGLSLGTPSFTPSKPGEYKAILDALRTIGDTKILSSPRILALNNQEAKILIGSKEVYVSQTISQTGTGTEVTADQVNFVDVGIKLYVTPTINRDGFITMKIKPEISSTTRSYEYGDPKKKIPIVDTSEAETTVMVKDGVTLIIGGLKKDKRKKDVTKIPILGDIPGLGYLFRKTDESLDKTELVILLTPHLLSGDASITDMKEMPPKDGIVAKMVKGDIIKERVSPLSKDEELVTATDEQYNKLVIDKIKAQSSFVLPRGEKGEVEISFTVDSYGQLKNEPKIISSTNPNLNNIVIGSLKKASPFPLFPESLNKTEETFQITLEYK